MHELSIKPLSVNQAWKGRRFKTAAYKRFEKECALVLPPKVQIPNGRLQIEYEFGVSYKGCDLDNPVKTFQDILQKKYGFNDSRIYKAIVTKKLVAKGSEYIRFNIEELESNAA